MTDDSGWNRTNVVQVYIVVIVEEIKRDINANCTAYIRSIDMYGNLHVKFNHQMVPIPNITAINKTMLDLYIVPSPDRDEKTFNVRDVNFTWTTNRFFKDSLWLKLKFYKPVEISKTANQDIL